MYTCMYIYIYITRVIIGSCQDVFVYGFQLWHYQMFCYGFSPWLVHGFHRRRKRLLMVSVLVVVIVSVVAGKYTIR